MTEEKDKTRLGVSIPQVVGAALAAVTAAFVGSVLGVYGTVMGAGLASILTTVGATLYQRSIERTKDKVKDTVAKVPVKALRSQSVVAQPIEPESAEPESAEPGSGTKAQQPDLPAQRGQEGHRPAPLRRPELPRRQVHSPLPKPQVRADTHQTRVFRPIAPGAGQTGSQPRDATQSGSAQSGGAQSGSAQSGSAQSGSAQSGSAQSGSTQYAGGSPRTGQQWPGQDPDQTRMQDADRLRFMRPAVPGEQATRYIDQRTQQIGQRTERIAPEAQQTNVIGATGTPESGEAEQEQPGKKGSKLKWSLIALTAALAFGIAMLAVNGFELATGKSISGDSHRTTFSGVLNPGSGQQQQEQPAEQQPAPVEPTEESVPPQDEAPQQAPEEGSQEDTATSEQPSPEEQDQSTTEPQQPPVQQQPGQQPAPQPAPQPGLQQGSSEQ